MAKIEKKNLVIEMPSEIVELCYNFDKNCIEFSYDRQGKKIGLYSQWIDWFRVELNLRSITCRDLNDGPRKISFELRCKCGGLCFARIEKMKTKKKQKLYLIKRGTGAMFHIEFKIECKCEGKIRKLT